ncbi:MAG: PKD domain-containing protein, partial [Bacteroidetes bacterium]|nr:PKD domain-containing protein [Bacteroidota bacterium]
KANSMGDLEALCDDAPLQIGNRVWADKNCNGVQDACEAPIPGVWVSLYDANTGALLATTKTDTLGEYYFTGLGTPGENWIATADFDSIKASYDYKIVFGTDGVSSQFDVTEGKLKVANNVYTLTAANHGAGHYPDLNDSDAEIAAAPGKGWDKLPTIMYTTGLAGHTDHTLDAGFCPEGIVLTACEDVPNSGKAIFNLNNANILVDPSGTHIVTYHATEAGAQSGSTALTTPYLGTDGEVIYARVANTSGFALDVVSIKLKVAASPIAYVAQLQTCPIVFDGASAVFNLHNADAQVAHGVAGLKVTYYDSKTLAEQGLNALPFTYTSVTKNIWARLENAAGCYDIDVVQLVVLPSPGVVLLTDKTTCSGATNGKINAIVIDGPAQYTFNWSNGVVQGPTSNPLTTLNGLAAGSYTVTLTDGNGCTVSSTATVENGIPFAILPLNDLGPLCPGTIVPPITLNTTIYGASFSWTGGAAVGLQNGTASSQLPQIPGFTTKSGVATITVTATNGQCIDTEQFTINAIDEVAPTFLNCPTQMIMVACDGTGGPGCSAKVNWADPAAIDNCGVPTVVQTSGPPSGSQIPAGDPITIVYTATDASGNTAICSFQVMVVDVAPPSFAITMPANTTVSCDNVPAMLNLTLGQIHENCGGQVTIEQNEVSTQNGDEANSKHYNYTITRKWLVTDASGNKATHEQIVTVKDQTAPTALCKNLTLQLATGETASITPAMVNNGSNDNCAPTANLNLSINNYTFSLSNLGNNNVTLLASDPSGNAGQCVAVVTIASSQVPPVATFEAVQAPSCEGPFSVQFTDQSSGNPSAWLWNFPGGTPATSTEQSPVVTYQNEGNFMATLKVSNSVGENTMQKSTRVAAMTNPIAAFEFAKNNGTVNFTNESTQAQLYLWNFGDGTTSTEANPTHTYAQNGTYFVLLNAMNGCGSSVLQKTVLITNTTATQGAEWLEEFLLYPNPNTGTYTVQVIGKASQEMSFTLYNAIGQVVRYESADFRTGELTQLFNYSDLPSGLYTLGVQSGNQIKYVKVAIQH